LHVIIQYMACKGKNCTPEDHATLKQGSDEDFVINTDPIPGTGEGKSEVSGNLRWRNCKNCKSTLGRKINKDPSPQQEALMDLRNHLSELID
jgi:hypothetical protein